MLVFGWFAGFWFLDQTTSELTDPAAARRSAARLFSQGHYESFGHGANFLQLPMLEELLI